MRFSYTTAGQKRIEPLKRVFILQASLEMEIACVILFFMLRETFIGTFDWKEIKRCHQLSLKCSWFKHFLLCGRKNKLRTTRTSSKKFSFLTKNKMRFFQNFFDVQLSLAHLRWPVPIYMRVGYVFDSRFSEWKIQPISMIFGILNK